VAIRESSAVGHIFFSRARLQFGPQVLALAPMAVLPEHQRQGVGGILIAEALNRAEETEFPLMVVVGHADYYPGFGFEPADPLGIRAPFDVPSEAWMAYRLPAYTPEARGTVIYPEAFASVV
jgi:putative acetyltransferase